MKKIILFLVGAALFGTAMFAQHHWSTHQTHADAHAHEQEAGHGHEQHAGQNAMSLNDGQRWATDEPLRIGMQRIHEALTLKRIDLAHTTRQQVDYLITHCQLEPQADATLHVIIAQLLAGAELLENKPTSSEGVEKIRGALQQYPEFFDHPGWHE